MFRVLDVPLEGQPTLCDTPGHVAPPDPGTVRWIDFEGPSHEHLTLLGDRFGFHPLALEDSAHFDQRPKLEDYDEYLFLVTHGFRCPSADVTDVRTVELHAFLGRGYLVTVHTDPIDALDAVFLKAYSDGTIGRRGADFLYYLVIDGMVDAGFPILDRIGDRVEVLENEVLSGQASAGVAPLFELKRTLAELRRLVSPQRDVVAVLAKHEHPLLGVRTAPYFRDVYDHLVRTNEAIEAARDLLGTTLDAYLSMASHRTNEIMKRLTLMSAIFLPLTFVTGFFGQNFVGLPFESKVLLYTMLGSCVLIPGVMIGWFASRRWL